MPLYTDLDIWVAIDSFRPGMNPYSARGLRGAFSPIDAARGIDKLARTINGTLIDLSAPQMHKYRLEVTGADQAPPALDGLWVGQIYIVSSMVEVAYQTGFDIPTRAAVPGSERTEGVYTYYRPQLTMMVVDWQITREEWEANVPWTLTLEEV